MAAHVDALSSDDVSSSVTLLDGGDNGELGHKGDGGCAQTLEWVNANLLVPDLARENN